MSKTILIQGAMDEELDILISSAESKETIASWTFYHCKQNDSNLIISRTEVGLVNASAATAIAIERFKPSCIINQGTSGAHDPSLHTHDIVIGKKYINIGAYETEYRNSGIYPEAWKNFATVMRFRENEIELEHDGFCPDKILYDAAMSVKYSKGNIVEGVIGSADEWNNELDRIDWFHNKFKTSVEEMETSAAAQVAAAYKIPFLGIRVVSNTIIHKEDYNVTAAQNCQRFVMELVNKLIK